MFQTLSKQAKTGIRLGSLLMLLFGVSFAGCRVEKTQEGELPEVEVEAEGGQMPKYDVDAAEVEVGTETKEIQVPDVDINPPDDEGDEDPNSPQ